MMRNGRAGFGGVAAGARVVGGVEDASARAGPANRQVNAIAAATNAPHDRGLAAAHSAPMNIGTMEFRRPRQ
jgi:hypothetical protein